MNASDGIIDLETLQYSSVEEENEDTHFYTCDESEESSDIDSYNSLSDSSDVEELSKTAISLKLPPKITENEALLESSLESTSELMDSSNQTGLKIAIPSDNSTDDMINPHRSQALGVKNKSSTLSITNRSDTSDSDFKNNDVQTNQKSALTSICESEISGLLNHGNHIPKKLSAASVSQVVLASKENDTELMSVHKSRDNGKQKRYRGKPRWSGLCKTPVRSFPEEKGNDYKSSSSSSQRSSDSEITSSGEPLPYSCQRSLFIKVSPLSQSQGGTDHENSGIFVHKDLLENGGCLQNAADKQRRPSEAATRKRLKPPTTISITHPLPDRKTIVASLLPTAERERDLSMAMQCLESADPFLVDRTVGCVEQLLLLGDYSKADSSLRPCAHPHCLFSIEQMLELVKKTASKVWELESFGDPPLTNDEQQRVWRCRNLLLMACCALLSHPASSSLDHATRQSLRTVLSKGSKSTTRFFADDFLHALSSAVSYHEEDWEKVLNKEEVKKSKKKKNERQKPLPTKGLKEANTVQISQRCFSLMNAMAKAVWDRHFRDLRTELMRVMQVVGKQKKGKRKIMLEFFVVRSSVVLLLSVLYKDLLQVDRLPCNSLLLMSELLDNVLRSAKKHHQKNLLKELYPLIRHPSADIRKVVVEWMEQHGEPLYNANLAILRPLVSFGLIMEKELESVSEDRPVEEASKLKKPCCKWQNVMFRGPNRRTMEGAILFPCRRFCLSKNCTDRILHSQPTAKHVTALYHRLRNQLHLQHLEMSLRVGHHPNVLGLLAYQLQPTMSQFYIRSGCPNGSLLLDALINDRGENGLLGKTQLLNVALQILSALKFLKQKGIVLRHLCTSNMVCDWTEEMINGVKGLEVKIADLGLSHESVYENDKHLRVHIDPGPCALLWLSPEALFEGRFGLQSVVYAFGYVLHELFTKGCEPYTEMSHSRDEILRLLFLHSPSVRPFQWPCIPDDVFQVIRWCTDFDPGRRPHLEDIEMEIRDLFKKKPIILLSDWVIYPRFKIDQEARKHLPETGIPGIVHSIKSEPNKYQNLKLSSWITPQKATFNAMALGAADSFSIGEAVTVCSCEGPCRLYDTCTIYTPVKERLTEEFVKNFLPQLEVQGNDLYCVVCWVKNPAISKGEEYYLQTRLYEHSEPLIEFAKRLNTSDAMLLKLCLELALAVRCLHQHGWLLCDLRASHVIISSLQSGRPKVTLARIGRMIRLEKSLSVCGKRHSDSTPWSAPEVLLKTKQKRNNVTVAESSLYSKKSDAFSLATTIWELYNASFQCSSGSSQDPLSFIPLANMDLNEIPGAVQIGVLLPPQPLSQVPKLYDIICSGRNPDREQRASIDQIVKELDALHSSFTSPTMVSFLPEVIYDECENITLSHLKESAITKPPKAMAKIKHTKGKVIKRLTGLFNGKEKCEAEKSYVLGYTNFEPSSPKRLTIVQGLAEASSIDNDVQINQPQTEGRIYASNKLPVGTRRHDTSQRSDFEIWYPATEQILNPVIVKCQRSRPRIPLPPLPKPPVPNPRKAKEVEKFSMYALEGSQKYISTGGNASSGSFKNEDNDVEVAPGTQGDGGMLLSCGHKALVVSSHGDPVSACTHCLTSLSPMPGTELGSISDMEPVESSVNTNPQNYHENVFTDRRNSYDASRQDQTGGVNLVEENKNRSRPVYLKELEDILTRRREKANHAKNVGNDLISPSSLYINNVSSRDDGGVAFETTEISDTGNPRFIAATPYSLIPRESDSPNPGNCNNHFYTNTDPQLFTPSVTKPCSGDPQDSSSNRIASSERPSRSNEPYRNELYENEQQSQLAQTNGRTRTLQEEESLYESYDEYEVV